MLSYGKPLLQTVLKQSVCGDVYSKSPSGTPVTLRQMLFLVIKEKNITICTNGVQYIIGGKEKGLTVVRISIFIYIYTHAYKHTHTHMHPVCLTHKNLIAPTHFHIKNLPSLSSPS